MGREIKRVPMDFDFPLGESWHDAQWDKNRAACDESSAPDGGDAPTHRLAVETGISYVDARRALVCARHVYADALRIVRDAQARNVPIDVAVGRAGADDARDAAGGKDGGR